MRKQIVSLAAVAALALVGVGAATTTAQAASNEVKVSEVLAQTNKDANPLGPKIDGVEIVKPENMSIQGYEIESCSAPDANGVSTLSFVATIDDNLALNKGRTAASNQPGDYDYDFDNSAPSLNRLGGVRLIDASGNLVDAVTFNPASTAVAACLTGNPLGNPDAAPAPTDITSAQRLDDGTSEDTGAFTAGAPTFEPMSGSENTIGD